MPIEFSEFRPSIQTPNPLPARGVYGFALYLTAWILFVLYLTWAIVPTSWLTAVRITYLPSKYWAIAVPLLFPILVTTFVSVVFALNLIRFHRIFENVAVVENDFSDDLNIKKPVNLDAYFVRAAKKEVALTMRRVLQIQSLRYGSGRAKRFTASVPSNVVTHGSLQHAIQQRLKQFQNDAKAIADQPSTSVYEADSLAADRFIQNDKDISSTIANRQRKLLEQQESAVVPEKVESSRELQFPLKAKDRAITDADISTNTESKVDAERVDVVDRGFYIHGDKFRDDYTAGTSFDMPEDDMNRGISIRTFGSSNAIESIEFQYPGQSTEILSKNRGADEEDDREWMSNYGAADRSIPPSQHKCGGCGAHFHCQDTALPGFVPVEMFQRIDRQKRVAEQSLCRRCYMLKKYNFLLNVNVCSVDYRSMMQRLKLVDEVLILLVIDMTDLPGSIHQQLPEIIGRRKPMIVIGNKIDLLPPDQRVGYLKNFKNVLINELRNAGFYDNFNILHTELVSAKTGFGVENLITQIYTKWSNQKDKLRNDMYLIGCTNAGKSTLFNTLLQSDICKVRAVDLVERATSSIWPGTTISMLKFPVMNPNPHKMELRRRRLLSQQTWIQKEQQVQKMMLSETGDSKYATLQSHVGNTFKELEDDLQPISNRQLNSIYGDEVKEKTTRKWSLDDHIFTKGNWCYDTPGTVNENQVSNMFSLEELVNVLPKQMLLPRTFLAYPGQTAFIGGVGRLDVIDVMRNRNPVYLTVFTSDRLPVNIIKTVEADAFLDRYLGSATLGAPLGDAERLKEFDKLEGKPFTIQSKGKERSGGDIVFSSIGWISVTTTAEAFFTAYTVGGRGLYLREPLLPYAANLRGARIAGTPAYAVQSVTFPEPRKKKTKPRRTSRER